jgi:type II secretory pathway predicted ATPase ExeA
MIMYVQHFGLNTRLFRASATGSDVFVGPNIAATMAGIKKALSANDAIVSVSGAVGSGKTTLATHALESISGSRIIVHVRRMRLASEDVLEHLLDELGIEDKPRGTIQRFAILRRKLKELEDNKTRVFITIEDSVRLGADALAEIEALTSADAGESEGASIILMGDDGLETLLGEAQLVRVQQRIRQRFTVAALSTTEMQGYLRHCFRLAGGEFEAIFEANGAQLLHYLSGGIPRISNNLVESAMTAAVGQNLDRVSSALLSQIAENDYGLSTDDFDPTPPVEQPAQQKPETVPVPEPVAELATAQPPEPGPSPLPEPPVAAEKGSSPDEQDVLELIQDTLPDLKTLAPNIAAEPTPAKADAAVEPVPQPEPQAVPEPQAAAQPEPPAEVAPQPVAKAPAELQLEIESSGDDVPEWDRDPTMAELKPDLDALEQAMAFAQGGSTEPAAESEEPLPEPEPEVPEVMPEITLDNAISERIENELTDKAAEASPPASEDAGTDASNTETPAAAAPQQQNKQSDAELQQMAVELSKAKSIEDIDDKLAETLFGEELNSIAAQFAVIPQTAEPANDSSEIVADVAVDKPVQEPAKKPVNEVPAVAPHVSQSNEKPATGAPKKVDNSGKPMSTSQRLRTVRALNADSKPATPTPKPGVAARNHLPVSEPTSTPGSFEDQMNTSISDTQTQRVLKVVPPEDDEENGGGFFNRFKRS